MRHHGGWQAFVDESESDRVVDPGVYLLAAAVVTGETVDACRNTMIALRERGQRKLHWHDESEARRRKIAAAVAGLDVLHLVVIRTGCHASERSERRRRKCLERLLLELEAAGVADVCMEARERHQNDRDVDLLKTMRSRGSLSAGMRLDHAYGPSEPMLWIPDAVAGAVTAARLGRPGHREQIEGALQEYVIGS